MIRKQISTLLLKELLIYTDKNALNRSFQTYLLN